LFQYSAVLSEAFQSTSRSKRLEFDLQTVEIPYPYQDLFDMVVNHRVYARGHLQKLLDVIKRHIERPALPNELSRRIWSVGMSTSEPSVALLN
jgi:hypothetical protein